MPRRKRIIIRPAAIRQKEYERKVDVGAQSWENYRDVMAENARGGIAFTAEVDRIIDGVITRHGVYGQSRIKYFVVGRKLAKMIVGYKDLPIERLAEIAENIIQSYVIQEGIDVNIARDIAASIINNRDRLMKVYGLAA